jgi:hypothetical protein
MTIARLKSTLTQRDDDEPGPAGTGVREPRRPAPEAGSVAAAVELPRWCDEAAARGVLRARGVLLLPSALSA